VKRALRRLLILTLSLLLAAVLGEVIVRGFDPLGVSQYTDMQRYLREFILLEPRFGDRLFGQRPATTVAFRDFTIATNDLGLRGPAVAMPKPAGTTRILFLGDSVVLGWGANDDATFVRRAQAELDRRNPGRRVECVNAGHNMFDTTQEAALLKDLLAGGLEPDAVILVFVYNDILLTRDEIKAYTEAAASAKAPGWLARQWMTVRTEWFVGLNNLWTYLSVVSSGAEKNDRTALVAKAMDGDAPGWQACRQALLAIRDECARRKIPFAVLDHTEPTQIPQLEKLCHEEKIRWHPFRFTAEEVARPIRHSAADPHANALGHELFLGKLRPALRELGLATD
jgi:hypothetical protein